MTLKPFGIHTAQAKQGIGATSSRDCPLLQAMEGESSALEHVLSPSKQPAEDQCATLCNTMQQQELALVSIKQEPEANAQTSQGNSEASQTAEQHHVSDTEQASHTAEGAQPVNAVVEVQQQQAQLHTLDELATTAMECAAAPETMDQAFTHQGLPDSGSHTWMHNGQQQHLMQQRLPHQRFPQPFKRNTMYSSLQELANDAVQLSSPNLGLVKHRSKKHAEIYLSPAHLIHVPRAFLQEHYDLQAVLDNGIRVEVDADGELDPDVIEAQVANYQNKSGYSYHRLLGFKPVCRKYEGWRVVGWQAVDAGTVRLCISRPARNSASMLDGEPKVVKAKRAPAKKHTKAASESWSTEYEEEQYAEEYATMSRPSKKRRMPEVYRSGMGMDCRPLHHSDSMEDPNALLLSLAAGGRRPMGLPPLRGPNSQMYSSGPGHTTGSQDACNTPHGLQPTGSPMASTLAWHPAPTGSWGAPALAPGMNCMPMPQQQGCSSVQYHRPPSMMPLHGNSLLGPRPVGTASRVSPFTLVPSSYQQHLQQQQQQMANLGSGSRANNNSNGNVNVNPTSGSNHGTPNMRYVAVNSPGGDADLDMNIPQPVLSPISSMLAAAAHQQPMQLSSRDAQHVAIMQNMGGLVAVPLMQQPMAMGRAGMLPNSGPVTGQQNGMPGMVLYSMPAGQRHMMVSNGGAPVTMLRPASQTGGPMTAPTQLMFGMSMPGQGHMQPIQLIPQHQMLFDM